MTSSSMLPCCPVQELQAPMRPLEGSVRVRTQWQQRRICLQVLGEQEPHLFIYLFLTSLSCTGQGLMGDSLSFLCTAAWGCSEDACFPNVSIQTANNK